jgi:hypothetical protein
VRQFHRIEVLSLHVLDDRQFKSIGGCDIRDDCGQRFAIGELTGSEPPLSHDELVSIPGASNDDGLKHAMLANGVCEPTQGRFVKFPSRLIWIRID